MTSRMHPGWKVFFQGALSGLLVVPFSAFLMRQDWWGAGIVGTVMLFAFIRGGTNAENLTDRKDNHLARAKGE